MNVEDKQALGRAFAAHLKSAHELIQLARAHKSAADQAKMDAILLTGGRVSVMLSMPDDRWTVAIFVIDAAGKGLELATIEQPNVPLAIN